jgi:hypothetical protein
MYNISISNILNIFYIINSLPILYILHIFIKINQLISSIRVTEETKRELAKIGGELTAKDGIERSMEDILKILINAYRKK